MNRIEKTIEYLRETFENAPNREDRLADLNYRYEHTLRVANIGKTIAVEEGLDVDALVIACLLHDISYVNEFQSQEEAMNHGRLSASMVRGFVESLGFDDITAHEMLYGIATHVDDIADFDGEHTVLSLSVSDSDNIDRFDVYRIYEGLKWEDFDQLPLDEKLELCANRIIRLTKHHEMEYATKTATILWREKVAYQLTFFKKLQTQLSNSTTVK